MQPDIQRAPAPKWMLWVGYCLSALPVAGLLMSAAMKLIKPPGFEEGLQKLGWDENLVLALAIVELTCTVIYVIPQTAVLGAILLTGYLGGAIATHVRIHEQFVPPLILGVLVWGGLWMRDERVRALLPIRSSSVRGQV
jgi:DoxX-like family